MPHIPHIPFTSCAALAAFRLAHDLAHFDGHVERCEGPVRDWLTTLAGAHDLGGLRRDQLHDVHIFARLCEFAIDLLKVGHVGWMSAGAQLKIS